MPLVDALLPEFDREMTTTRKLLERLPEKKFDWKPHAKSYSLCQLAAHVATIPMWGAMTVNHPEVDITTGPPPGVPPSKADLLAAFDAHAAGTRAALVGKTDAELMATWSLKRDGHVIFSMPKAAVWRSFVLNHLVHHRGQLSVYLRMLDVPIPSIYGPSADERAF
ncbi:MAG: DinB family protein [Acidobacteria bacterium]|nr:DinB family protein [Acidobacteriota bacterium]